MKAISLLITLVFLFSPGKGVLAQETELPSPGLLPDSPFYFLEIIAEEIGTFFTFGDIRKAERYAALAAERLAEARAMVETEKPELAEKTLERYRTQLQNSMARVEKAQTKGQNIERVMEVVARIGKATSIHLEVLAEIYDKVSDEAKPSVENAMKVSVKGHEKAVEALKAQDALGEIPEEALLSAEVPAEVRERIQTRVRQELEIEKALEGIDLSKPLRTICLEQGGTPEMCEEFPLQRFESFKQIETFCIEKGGPPEICSSVETMCREYGATEPNECFLLLSISSIKAYTSTELRALPGPSLSEEEMEETRRREEESTRTGSAYFGVRSLIIVDDSQAETPVHYGALLIGREGEDAVIPDSPAALAGLKEGDIILEFQGERITRNNSLTEKIYLSEAGTTVRLKVLRGEEEFIINVELVKRPANLE